MSPIEESALWFDKGKTSAAASYPEFRAWHAMIEPLFGITPPDWPEPKQDAELNLQYEGAKDEAAEEDEES